MNCRSSNSPPSAEREQDQGCASETPEPGLARETGTDGGGDDFPILPPAPSPETHSTFATQWSVVLAARQDNAQGREALGRLCQTYWRPLYFFVRRQGHNPAEAEDLTQEFFARLLEKKALSRADPARGRFRSFLFASMRHFLVNEWEQARAQKRGGGARLISLDTMSAETRYGLEPVDHTSPDKLYEREWAVTLMEQVLERLKAEQSRAGKLAQFDLLKQGLMGDGGTAYAELATRLRTTEDAVKMAVHRLRKRYGELLRDEIAQTVNTEEEIQEEIQHLLAALRRE